MNNSSSNTNTNNNTNNNNDKNSDNNHDEQARPLLSEKVVIEWVRPAGHLVRWRTLLAHLTGDTHAAACVIVQLPTMSLVLSVVHTLRARVELLASVGQLGGAVQGRDRFEDAGQGIDVIEDSILVRALLALEATAQRGHGRGEGRTI